MSDLWILDQDHIPRRVALRQWSAWRMEHPDTHVDDTTIGDIRISTVFLSIDHSMGRGPAVLFETMIFGADEDGDRYQVRYHTWNQAVAGHAEAVEFVRTWVRVADETMATAFAAFSTARATANEKTTRSEP